MISVSNIAWDTSFDEDVANVLSEAGVSYVDVAPGKYFSNFEEVTDQEILQVRNFWRDRGITVLGMQSLLFGTFGLNMFDSRDVQNKMLAHLHRVCHIGNMLGARKLTFGSPKNRDRLDLSHSQAADRAASFFYRLGEIACSEGVIICLEPNPACYKSNFMLNSEETAGIVTKTNHKSIKMQLDVGAMFINHESAGSAIRKNAHIIHHIHISEPQLKPLNSSNSFHNDVSSAIRKFLPIMPMTIEMLASNESKPVEQIKRSVNFVKKIYLR